MLLLKTKYFLSWLLCAAIAFGSAAPTLAIFDEGMFTPDQILRLPLARKGLKIRPIDIYNPNGVGLTDAIVRVNIGEAGGFGTGEFVSPNGLILTNHHVGFDALVSASTPGNDYGLNGYRATSTANELPAKGYSLLMTKRVENVTDKITAGTANLTGAPLDQAIKTNIANLEKSEQAKAAAGATIRVQSLNNGFFYYLYETTTVRDVRVVYAPPKNIGFFGGDPDNFEWSRHTGDFTFLRAYVAPDGTSAAYSTQNVPFKPKKFLTVSLGGLKENDFVFALGYPGGTTRYRENQSINYSQTINYPFLADYLQAAVDAYTLIGSTDEAKRVKLQAEIFSLNNSIKLYSGRVVSLKRSDFAGQRRAEEQKFAAWVNANPARRAKYGEVLANFTTVSSEFYRTAQRDRLLRTFPNAGFSPVMKQIFDAVQAVQTGKTLTPEKRAEITEVYKTREPVFEREMIKFFLRKVADLPNDQKFQPIENIFARFQGKERRSAEETLAESIAEKDFTTPEAIFALYTQSPENLRKRYPNVYEAMTALAAEQAEITARTNRFNPEANRLRLLYMQGMSEMSGETFYPDANASLRFTYGSVKGYTPREAVVYQPFTTLKGVIEKDTGVEPFDVPRGLKDLQRARNFGRFGAGDTVPVNFLATTDIIGGNSGSPILNAYGEQVGIVFDGNYEGLANDIVYNDNADRTIGVDIRYVLFVTEKFGNAGWILDEMQIKGAAARPARRAAR